MLGWFKKEEPCPCGKTPGCSGDPWKNHFGIEVINSGYPSRWRLRKNMEVLLSCPIYKAQHDADKKKISEVFKKSKEKNNGNK